MYMHVYACHVYNVVVYRTFVYLYQNYRIPDSRFQV